MSIRFQIEKVARGNGQWCLIVKYKSRVLLTAIYPTLALQYSKEEAVRNALSALEVALGDAVEIHFDGRSFKVG